MARIISTKSSPLLSLVIRTHFQNKTYTDKIIRENDVVTNLRYVEKGEIKMISGRISKINYSMKTLSRYYKNVLKIRSYFRYDVLPTTIEIDNSTENHSSVVTIPVMEIIEDSAVLNVVRMETFFTYGINLTIALSDTTTNVITLEEGQVVTGLTYLSKGGERTIDTKVVAITYDKDLNPLQLKTVADGVVRDFDMLQIKAIESITTPATPDTPLSSLIESTTGPVVYAGTGTFADSLEIKKDIEISGAKAGIPANTAKRDITSFEGETVLSGTVSCSADTTVTLDGVVLTEKALLSLGSAKEVTLKNCIITNLNPTAAKSFVVSTGTTPTKLNVSGCYFGTNKSVGGAFRNTLELNCKLKDGSVIANNYFEDGCSGNNDICIYDVDEGAYITVENNVWERSANGIRVGTKGDAICTIDIKNNTYYATDENNPEYAGLVLIQPYSSATTSMKNVTVNILNTTHKDNEQVYYLYSGGKDMKFTPETLPTVTLDGEVQDLTKYLSE